MPRLPLHRHAAVRHISMTLATVVAAVALAACNGTATPPASGSPSRSPGDSPGPSAAASPSPSSTVGAIDHKTGATDVVLRLESGGGFVPIDFLASQAPTFTLFGNGVIVFQRKVETFPEPDASGVTHGIPWRMATLDENQVQELLEFAITQGALGTARDVYMGNIADAPSTIFTIRAGGLDKTVTINGLSEDSSQGPDALARASFFKLSERLRDFDHGGAIDSDVYEPTGFRAVLLDRDPSAAPAIDWPWPSIKLSEFVDPNAVTGGIQLRHRVMTPAEVASLGIKEVAGGLQGVVLKTPDGKLVGLILRPLLADERE